MINWFNHMYPYGNLHELNLDWVIATVKHGEKDIADFIGINTIKYADPILWNIESQYEANTVVVDGQTGNAYISVKAVPSGVHLNRTEYWTQIYNYSNVVDTLREQIAHNEGDTTTATQSFAVDDLVFVGGLLYKVIAPMIAGDSFVENSNIVKTTIEEEMKLVSVAIHNEALARANADIQLQTNIDNEAEARTNADTQLQTNIDNEATARENADTQLQTNINNEATARENADTQLQTNINNIKLNYIDITKHGCVGDGVTDNTSAFTNVIALALESHLPIYIPSGTYILSDDFDISRCSMFGDNARNSILKFTSGHLTTGHFGNYLRDVTVELSDNNTDDDAISCYYMSQTSVIENVITKNGGISITKSWYFSVTNINIYTGATKPYGLKLFATQGEGGVNAGNFNGVFIANGVNGVIIDSTYGKCETNIMQSVTIEHTSDTCIKIIGDDSTNRFIGVYVEDNETSSNAIVLDTNSNSYICIDNVMLRGTPTSEFMFKGLVIAKDIISQSTNKKLCTDGLTMLLGRHNVQTNNGMTIPSMLVETGEYTNTTVGLINFDIKKGYQLIKAYTQDGYSCIGFFINQYGQQYGTLTYQGAKVTEARTATYTLVWLKVN